MKKLIIGMNKLFTEEEYAKLANEIKKQLPNTKVLVIEDCSALCMVDDEEETCSIEAE